MKLTIINPTKNDFDQIFVLLKQLFKRERLVKEKVRNIFIEQLIKEKRIFFIAKLEKRIIGFISLVKISNIQNQSKIGVIDEVIVDEEFRGQGLGKKLLKTLIKEARKEDCKEIHLSSTFKRKKAHKFYLKNKFNKTAYLFWKKI